MPKLKTRRATAKRFKISGGKKKKIKRGHAFRSHLLTGRKRKRKRKLRLTGYLTKADQERIRRLLPYG